MRDMARSDGRLGVLNVLVAALVGVLAFAAALSFGVPAPDPALWDEAAVAAGLRPPRSVVPGLWRLLAGWTFPLLGVRGAFDALSLAGAAFGGLAAALLCLVVRQVLALTIRVERHYPFWSGLVAPFFSAFAALAFAFSDPFAQVVRTLSPDLVRLVLLLLAVHGSLRWFALGGAWRLLALMAAMGLLASETPLGFLLPPLFALAYLAVRGCVADGLFPWPERLPEMEAMPKWLMLFVFLGGLAAGAWADVWFFESHGGLEANGLAHADVWLRYAAGLWRVAAGAATGVGWMLGLSFCVLPLVVAVRLQPLAVRDDRPLPFLLGLSMLAVGLLALLQTEAFPATRFWTLFPDAPPVRGGFLLAAFSACASSTLGLCGAAFAFECRRTYLKGKLGSPGPVLRWTVPACALLLLAVMAARLPRPAEAEMRRVVADAVRETVRECAGATRVFTDGHLDAALELEALAGGRTLRTVNMMSGASPWETALRRRGLDGADREAAETGAPVLLRTWASERPERMAESALQLGLELWKRDRREMPRSSGLVARTAGMDEAEAARGVAASAALAKRAMAASDAAAAASEVPPPAVSEALSAVAWRLSRFARLREDMALADGLEQHDSALRRMLTAVEYERMRTFMQMTPREGLRLALGRADFAAARSYAVAVLAFDEDDPEANFGMGMGELTTGRCREAEVHLRRCLVRRPDEPAVLNNLSIACRKLGRYAESEDYARRALERLPDSPEVKRTLADILAVRKRLGK